MDTVTRVSDIPYDPNRAARNKGVASGVDRAPRVPGALPRSLSGAHRMRPEVTPKARIAQTALVGDGHDTAHGVAAHTE